MKILDQKLIHEASFRDPSGFIFYRDEVLYRQINQVYKANFDRLTDSGLCQELHGRGLLIHHEEVELNTAAIDGAYKILKPERIPFVSYPYEWCFSQLKDAALTTLTIQKLALRKDMALKDASAFNIQFHRGKPILIDSLSFECYRAEEPWVGYRQFCQHFLAPLSLMSYRDIRLGTLLRSHIDGIPLDLASRLLPFRTYLIPSLLLHLHMHARSQKHYADKQIDKTKVGHTVSRHSMIALIDSLERASRKLKWKPPRTEWGEYYASNSYSDDALNHKKELVARFIKWTQAKTVWDLGANTGLFSDMSSRMGKLTIAFDFDPVAVERNYVKCREGENKLVLPLLLDLTNPSPSIGWLNRERDSLFNRGPVDLSMALALLHHLAISNNVPLRNIAEFFHKVSRWLIIEFIPKTDPQIERLLATREDIFSSYTQEVFEKEFGRLFTIETSEPIRGTGRKLYLMRRICK